MTTWSKREPGTGVPAVPWKVTEHAEDVADFDGHAFITADPKGMGRSVCNGFIDDMAWIAALHNAVIASGWRACLARRLLGLGELRFPAGAAGSDQDGERR